MPETYERTCQIGHYPLPRLVVECNKCKCLKRFDKTQLIEKLGEDYPVMQAVDRLVKD